MPEFFPTLTRRTPREDIEFMRTDTPNSPQDTAPEGILVLALQGDKRRTPELRAYRYMTRAEVPGSGHILVVLRGGRVGTVKINGAPRTWKRDAKRFELPVKYGMYDYATFSEESDGRIGNGVAYAIVEVK